MSSLNPELYQALLKALVAERKAAGLSQAAVGELIGQRQTFVSKYELGERRLDVAEFVMIAEAIGIEPEKLLKSVRRRHALDSLEA